MCGIKGAASGNVKGKIFKSCYHFCNTFFPKCVHSRTGWITAAFCHCLYKLFVEQSRKERDNILRIMLIHAFYRLCNKGFRFKVRKHIQNCRHDSFTVCGFDGIAADLKYGNPRNAVVRILDFSGIRSNRISVCKNSNRSCTAHAGHRFAQRIVGSKLYECRKRFYNVVSEFSGKRIA